MSECVREGCGHDHAGEATSLEQLRERAKCNDRWFGSHGYEEQWINFDLLREWLDVCDQSHPICRKEVSASVAGHLLWRAQPPPVQTPRWLVDVVKDRLIKAGRGFRYAALSYVWGQVKSSRTTKSNLGVLLKHGSLSSSNQDFRLPKTILHSVEICKKLNIRYLWVDILCIPQDDAAVKHSEIQKMGHIYKGAYVTLVAANGEDANSGMPGIRSYSPPRQRPHHVEAIDVPKWERRGWTFQELVLSSRVIFFRRGSCVWSCAAQYWDESWGSRYQRGDDALTWDIPPMRKHFKAWRLGTNPDIQEFLILAADYNGREFTYEADIQDAFTGVVNELEPLYGNFIYGLPEMFFDVALLWQPRGDLVRRTGASHLPSWSWIGWRGELDAESWDLARHYLRQPGLPSLRKGYRPCDSTSTWFIRRGQRERRIDCSFADLAHFKGSERKDLGHGWRLETTSHDSWYHHDRFDSSNPSLQFAFPVLFAPDKRSRPIHTVPLSPYLTGHVQRGSFRVSKHDLLGPSVIWHDDRAVGLVRLHSRDVLQRADSAAMVDFISICRAQRRPPLPGFAANALWRRSDDETNRIKEFWHLYEHAPSEGLRIHNVMLVENKDGIAYRAGLGWILESAWDACEQARHIVTITLG